MFFKHYIRLDILKNKAVLDSKNFPERNQLQKIQKLVTKAGP